MVSEKMNIIWVAWQKWPRNKWITKALGIKLYEIDNPGKLRYLLNIIETIKILNENRPLIVIAMFPSIFLTLFLLALKPKYRFKLVIDLHTIIADFHSHKSLKQKFISRIYNLIFIYLLKKVEMIIVTNEGYKSKILKINRNVLVLPDNIPDYTEPEKVDLEGAFNILYICSYSQDEPYEEILGLDNKIEKDIKIYVTGDYTKSRIKIKKQQYNNIIFTGYLSDKDYVKMLYSVDASIVLTNYENCLVCGAYESIAAGTPLILSNKKALRNYFSKGIVYTKNNKESILKAINIIRDSKEMYSYQIKKLRTELNKAYDRKIKVLITAIKGKRLGYR